MNVLGWMKTNWIIVVTVAVILIVPPVSWYFSTQKAKTISAERQREAERLFGEVRNLRTTYVLPAATPGDEGVTFSYQPNSRAIQWFREQNERLSSGLQQVVQEAVEFNRRGRSPVIEGVLPTPPDDRTRRQTLLLEFAKAFVPDPARPGQSVYERMLADINAGGPASRADLAQELSNIQDLEMQRRQSASPDGQVAPEELDEIRTKLVNQRLGQYSSRAREISVYADLTIFPKTPEQSPYYPHTPVSGPPTVKECFRWQYDAWLAQDLLAAIKTANTADGRLLSLEEAPVKRIRGLGAAAPAFAAAAVVPQTGRYGRAIETEPIDAGTDPTTALIESNFDRDLTGRGAEPNQLYDVRQASILLYVDSARLPRVLDAFGETNFMTVTDVRITNLDLDAELSQGFYYGDDYVVQVQVWLEALYLREWTERFMPAPVRAALGLPEIEPETEEGEDGAG